MKYRVKCKNLGVVGGGYAHEGEILEASAFLPEEIGKLLELGAIGPVGDAVDEPAADMPLESLTRAQLNLVAEGLGIDGKKLGSKAKVIAAIEQARADQAEREAESEARDETAEE